MQLGEISRCLQRLHKLLCKVRTLRKMRERIARQSRKNEHIKEEWIDEDRQLWRNTRTKLEDYGDDELTQYCKDNVNDQELYEINVKLQNDCDFQEHELKMKRIREWRQRMRESLRTTRAAVFRWVRGYKTQNTRILKREDGSWATEVGEVHDLLLRFWKSLFNEYTEGTMPPTWEDFRQEYANYIQEWPCPQITCDGDRLRDKIKSMKTGTSTGTDGMSIQELKQLPMILLHQQASNQGYR